MSQQRVFLFLVIVVFVGLILVCTSHLAKRVNVTPPQTTGLDFPPLTSNEEGDELAANLRDRLSAVRVHTRHVAETFATSASELASTRATATKRSAEAVPSKELLAPTSSEEVAGLTANWRERLAAVRGQASRYAEAIATSASELMSARSVAMERSAKAARATWSSAAAMVKDVDALGAVECGVEWAGVAGCLRRGRTSPLGCAAKLPQNTKCYGFVQRVVDRVQPAVEGFDKETSARCELQWGNSFCTLLALLLEREAPAQRMSNEETSGPASDWRDRLAAARTQGRLYADAFALSASELASTRAVAMERSAEAARATWSSAAAMVKDVDAIGAAECGVKWAGVARCLRDDSTSPLDCAAKLPRDSKCYGFVQRVVDRVQPAVEGFDKETSARCELQWASVRRCLESGGGRDCVAQVPQESTCYHYVVDQWARRQMRRLPTDMDTEMALKCGVRWAGVAACLGAGGTFTCLAGLPQDSACYAFVEKALGNVRNQALSMELASETVGL
eukprot:CAMPEP_0174878526 /NCGR_PEP_ID=MMETSP1114-20130205/82804_1 /TAXON_ID=312471 /ORGANISM="Neobodo designis, Strain CCAP 1951/1" /LENGTH=507 /DNA_ID=CAMNT_0016113915 /DNA_START=84 /DNA_END=1609 /DNA_ORIENTATION=-